jgi:hypothetical protein
MWQEITKVLKEELPEAEYNLWLSPITERLFHEKLKELSLYCPNEYFVNRIKENYAGKIKKIAKRIFNKNIKLMYQPLIPSIAEELSQPAEKSTTFFIKKELPQLEKNTFNDSPYFKNHSEFNNFIHDVQLQKVPKKIVNLNSMPCKYGTENVATFSMFDSRFFAYPNDKRKKAVTNLEIKLTDGTSSVVELRRGQVTPIDKGFGQLTTEHAKIFLAICHIWQNQGSKYANDKSYFAVVNISVRELAKQLGYKKVSGAEYSRLLYRIKELSYFPNLLSNGNGGEFSFTFLSDVSAWRKNDRGKRMLRITFNPLISKQLFERKTFLRNSLCYCIKNPTAFKLLMCYDSRIIKGNKLKIEIHDIASDLELNSSKLSNLVSVLRTATRELDGFELNENYRLRINLMKEGKQYFVTAEREPQSKSVSVPALQLLKQLGLTSQNAR